MSDTPLTARLAQGPLTAPTSAEDGWKPHPKFAGVRMKSLVSGRDSGGAFTTLMVRIEPGMAMLPHVHEGQTEQHLVLDGEGRMTLDGIERDYAPGTLIVIPKATGHSVVAGPRGMVLTALFSPAID
jgi:quercetin dioxygenase-like cupin family protein